MDSFLLQADFLIQNDIKFVLSIGIEIFVDQKWRKCF